MPGGMGGFGNDWYITKKDFQYYQVLLFGNAHASSLGPRRQPILNTFNREYSVSLHLPRLNTPCTALIPTVQQTFSHCNFNHFLTSLRSTFREALKINTLLSREIPILLLTFYRKRHPLAGGTSSIVHYREYPSDQWDFFVKTQLTIHLKRECQVYYKTKLNITPKTQRNDNFSREDVSSRLKFGL